MGSPFNEDYFERGEAVGVSLYSSYRWMPELTISMAHELIVHLGIKKTATVMDYGCAKGFLVKALRMLHHKAWGVDISEYAINTSPEDVRGYLFHLDGGKLPLASGKPYDWTISKDVLEHIPYENLYSTLESIAESTRRAFIIVPLGDGQKYNAPEYEKDATHIIRQNMTWWEDRFLNAGFSINAATTDLPYIKKERCKDSDGFFTLTSRC